MKRFVVASTLALLATPALASRPPQTATAIYEPASQAIYPRETNEPVFRHRRRYVRHAHRHPMHGHRHHTVKEVRHHNSRRTASIRSDSRLHETQPRHPDTSGGALPIIDVIDQTIAAFEGFLDGMAMPRPAVVKSRPRHLIGELTINGKKFAYASGGSGWSIPFGDHLITPSEVGSWGKRHNAIGIANDEIPDKQLGRTREGIEIHASDHLSSAGCVVVASEHYAELKHAIFAMIGTAGQAYLHVGPSGAVITATQESPLPPIIYLAEYQAAEHGEDTGQEKHTKHREHHQKTFHRIHLAERIADEERHAERKSRHSRVAHHELPHRKHHSHYASHHRYPKA